MRRMPSKAFRCSVVSENVMITLQRRITLGVSGKLFVRCSESDCQYVDTNQPPCPLTLDMFSAEIEHRMTQQPT